MVFNQLHSLIIYKVYYNSPYYDVIQNLELIFINTLIGIVNNLYTVGLYSINENIVTIKKMIIV